MSSIIGALVDIDHDVGVAFTGEGLVASLRVVGLVLVYAVLVAVRVVGERLAVFP